MLDVRPSVNNALTSVLGNADLLLLEPDEISPRAATNTYDSLHGAASERDHAAILIASGGDARAVRKNLKLRRRMCPQGFRGGIGRGSATPRNREESKAIAI